ncbi:hypothetical protein D3C73_1380250 [compost metagenome]
MNQTALTVLPKKLRNTRIALFRFRDRLVVSESKKRMTLRKPENCIASIVTRRKII